MRYATVVSLALLVALAGCQKKAEEPSASKAADAPAQEAPECQGEDCVGDQAAPAPEAAKPEPELQVAPPTAEDLDLYTADLDGDGPLMATFETSMGDIHCELFAKQVPMTVANFVGLARGLKPFRHPATQAIEKRPFYDGLKFHRVIPNFMVQGGDPLGVGRGGPGYKFADEFVPELKHDKGGLLSMANSGRDTNGSQFFITEVPTPHLDNRHTVFGECAEVDLIKKITRVPKQPGSSSTPAEDVVIQRLVISRGKQG